MLRDNSDASWEKWGKQNPYYAVLTDNKFRNENLNGNAITDFFETGCDHVERVLKLTSVHLGGISSRKSALDFGCGVGRLVIPFAKKFEHVTAVDVSETMLETAKENCSKRNVTNVDFVRSDDELTKVVGKFDFIHSYIVLQHIPVRRGEQIIGRLSERLSNGGILALHFPFLSKKSSLRRSTYSLRKNFIPLQMLANLVLRRSRGEPFMQMNCYRVDRVLNILSDHGIVDIFIEVEDVGDGFVSAFVFAKRLTQAQ